MKRAEEKYQILEDKLYDLRRRQQGRPFSESRFDSPGKNGSMYIFTVAYFVAGGGGNSLL